MNLRKKLINLSDFSYFNKLDYELKDCDSVLDVGCGSDSPLKKVKRKQLSIGIDIFKPSIEKSKKKKIHNDYRVGNVLKLDKMFKNKSFDCVIALDLIEHFEKKEVTSLLKKMEKIAVKKIIILTPNGFTKQDLLENNPYQLHKSGWSKKDLQKLGFKVYGMRGLKYLRKEHATLRFKPWIFWGIVSTVSQLLTYFVPNFSYQLFAVKEINKTSTQ